ncbi:MAG: hypothetical protein LBS70_09475, partial [Candidatus Accumulibacter sp.]|nr:hypothetical protein [Accumulibacter sp.]
MNDEFALRMAQHFSLLLERQTLALRRIAGYGARREAEEIKTRLAANPKRLEPFGFKVYSQNDEDGIVEEIFRRLGVG